MSVEHELMELHRKVVVLREELSAMTKYRDNAAIKITRLRGQLTAAEQRNALPPDWQDRLILEMETRFELNKHDDNHMVYDDTQIGVEFAIDWINAAIKPTESGASE